MKLYRDLETRRCFSRPLFHHRLQELFTQVNKILVIWGGWCWFQKMFSNQADDKWGVKDPISFLKFLPLAAPDHHLGFHREVVWGQFRWPPSQTQVSLNSRTWNARLEDSWLSNTVWTAQFPGTFPELLCGTNGPLSAESQFVWRSRLNHFCLTNTVFIKLHKFPMLPNLLFCNNSCLTAFLFLYFVYITSLFH